MPVSDPDPDSNPDSNPDPDPKLVPGRIRIRNICFGSETPHGTEFRVVLSSAEWFGTEFRGISVQRKSRNSFGINQLFRLFRLPRDNFFVGNCQP